MTILLSNQQTEMNTNAPSVAYAAAGRVRMRKCFPFCQLWSNTMIKVVQNMSWYSLPKPWRKPFPPLKNKSKVISPVDTEIYECCKAISLCCFPKRFQLIAYDLRCCYEWWCIMFDSLCCSCLLQMTLCSWYLAESANILSGDHMFIKLRSNAVAQ